MQKGAILLVDDDKDDQEMVLEIFRELKISNELLTFSRGQAVLDYLSKAEKGPFIILSDVNLPGMDGFELRQKILDTNSPMFHSVPFIFWSTAASSTQISRAYDMSVHGFFIKELSYEKTRTAFLNIFNYWNTSKMPEKEIL